MNLEIEKLETCIPVNYILVLFLMTGFHPVGRGVGGGGSFPFKISSSPPKKREKRKEGKERERERKKERERDRWWGKGSMYIFASQCK